MNVRKVGGVGVRESGTKSGVLRHLAIAPDGNGRWAVNRGLPRAAGHEVGAKVLLSTIDTALRFNIPFLSVHIFSSENWRRSAEEVDFFLELYRGMLQNNTSDFVSRGIRVTHMGRRTKLPGNLLQQVQETERCTSHGAALSLQFCADYGGRIEVIDVMKNLAREIAAGTSLPSTIDDETFSRLSYYPNLPDVDLYIRTSGVSRTSNFMFWQMAYAEIRFVEVLWPDFSARHLEEAIADFSATSRRFGSID